jgi:hypothetical protein
VPIVTRPEAATIGADMGCWKGRRQHCSKFVVVRRSERVKSGTDGSSRLRCNYLGNIVKSEIFRTSQISGQVC